MNKRIGKILSICFLGLTLVACGRGKDKAEISDEAKLPLSEQKATALIKDKRATPEGEDYSQDEIASIGQNEYFLHLQNDDGSYANVLKHSYLKNLLYQELKTENGDDIKIGSMIKDPSKPTLFMITRSNCPYCREVLDDLVKTYNPKDFNLILGEGHISQNQDIEEDAEGVATLNKELGSDRLKDYHAYGVDPLMDELHAVYYPTLIYLDSNGYIINVSGAMGYGEIINIFEKTLGAKVDNESEKPVEKAEEPEENVAKVDSEIVNVDKKLEDTSDVYMSDEEVDNIAEEEVK